MINKYLASHSKCLQNVVLQLMERVMNKESHSISKTTKTGPLRYMLKCQVDDKWKKKASKSIENTEVGKTVDESKSRWTPLSHRFLFWPWFVLPTQTNGFSSISKVFFLSREKPFHFEKSKMKNRCIAPCRHFVNVIIKVTLNIFYVNVSVLFLRHSPKIIFPFL